MAARRQWEFSEEVRDAFRLVGAAGGKARAKKLSRRRRVEIARMGGAARAQSMTKKQPKEAA